MVGVAAVVAAVVVAAAPEGELAEAAASEPALAWVGDMAAARVQGMAEGEESATAVRRQLQGTRCKQRLRARTRMERITALQASARDTWGTQYRRRFQRCFRARTRIPDITVHQAMPGIPAHPASAQDTK
ncbi:hypothetical protein AOQ71_28275 [Bradyrhizobium manausense]|uniref:Uncharacterized protein n=1 Tax=Bradyrhizobium manausense TaxID=989370 RepID=A0A0R3D6W0_9BRAD|nr:hypothetical protein AOQ71_28275 [Bradyrhizobium manausense]